MSSIQPSTTKNIVQGVSWSVLMRWSLRLLGLINVAVLARLLSPEDYGIVAMAMLAYGMLSLFIDFGTAMLVMRADEVTDDLLNTAWTAKILQGILLSSGLLALTPLVVRYFNNPNLDQILWVYALAALISGFENIGIILFRKNLQYRQDFILEFITKVGSVALTIGLAVWLMNFWALVYGQLASSLLRLILSFTMHSYRPKICVKGIKQFLMFSLSLISINIGKYASQNISIIVGGRILATEALGILNVAIGFAAIFTQEIMLPVARAMFPQYAKIKHDPAKLRYAYLNVLGALSLILFPVGFGLAAVAFEAVTIVLGNKWLATVELVSWLSLAGVLRALSWVMSGNILIVTGNENKSAWCTWLQLIILAPAVIYAGNKWGMLAMVQAATLASLITLPIIILVLKGAIKSSFFEVFSYILKPASAAVCMYCGLIFIGSPWGNIFLSLGIKILIGAVIYGSVVLLLWFATGKPDGVESKVTRLIMSRVQKIKQNVEG